MSLYDYRLSMTLEAQETPFYALIMAAMRQADTPNVEKLRDYWPEVWFELQARYHAPGGRIPADYEKRKEEDRRLPADQGFVTGMEMREATEDRRK